MCVILLKITIMPEEWLNLHKEELLQNWEYASNNMSPKKIESLE